MPDLILLHTNDIHGRAAGLARVATLVAQIRADYPDVPVVYVDTGDSEEASQRLSGITKGVAMHRLLSAAGCDAVTIGNAAVLRYGPAILRDHAAVATYPLLLANLRNADGSPLAGTQPTAILDLGILRLGLIGLTAPIFGTYEGAFGLKLLPSAPLVQELIAALRQDGADAIVVLSHLGLSTDRELAATIQDLSLIIGAHSHDLLPEGERVGTVLIAQAGCYADHLGRIDLRWNGERVEIERASVVPISEDLPPAQALLDEIDAIEGELAAFLDEVIGELAQPLEYATDRECGVADLLADVLRARMHADIGLVSAGQAFRGPLPGGAVRRGVLWDVCPSTTKPCVAMLSGAQLQAIIDRGLDPRFAAERLRQLRGNARGLIHVSGATIRAGRVWIGDQPLDPQREYRVAATDWELEPYGGYVEAAWRLRVSHDASIIVREAIEEYLRGRGPVQVITGRIAP